jgi:hypothetical protein
MSTVLITLTVISVVAVVDVISLVIILKNKRLRELLKQKINNLIVVSHSEPVEVDSVEESSHDAESNILQNISNGVQSVFSVVKIIKEKTRHEVKRTPT